MTTLRLNRTPKIMIGVWGLLTQVDRVISLHCVKDDKNFPLSRPSLQKLKDQFSGICDKMEEIFFHIDSSIDISNVRWVDFFKLRDQKKISIGSGSMKYLNEFLKIEKPREVEILGNKLKMEPPVKRTIIPNLSINLNIPDITKVVRRTLGISGYKQVRTKNIDVGIVEICFYNGQFSTMPSNQTSQKMLDESLPNYLIDVKGVDISARNVQSYIIHVHLI